MNETMPRLLDHVVVEQRPRLVGLVARVVDWTEAEDVVQEALLRLEADPVRDRPLPEVTAWLRRVSLNLAFNHRRDLGRWRQRTLRAGTETTVDDPEVESLRSEEREMVRSVLDQLTDRYRNVLVLRHSGHSYAEIAAVLQMPVSSVGTTLARAEAGFRAKYEEEMR
jgi:RNA polymerase sigma factor (sigma-70 family)